jgi:hypothetical protein
MGDVPYPITAANYDDLIAQVQELVRIVFEDKIGGCDLGDVFSIVGNVLTITVASDGGIEKTNNELSIKVYADGGVESTTNGIQLNLKTSGGLEADSTGLGIKIDSGATLSASGLKITAGALTDGDKGDITVSGSGSVWTIDNMSSAALAGKITDETGSNALVFANTPTLHTPKIGTIKSGATQAAAGAAAGEIWKTASHATLPDNVLMIGV